MDKRNVLFLTIIKAALHGEKAEICDDISPSDWQRLFEMAETHKLLPLMYEAVYADPGLQALNLPFLSAVKQQVRSQVLRQTMKTSAFLTLNQQLRAAELTPLVVKGILCRSLYPKPDHRLSADEDLLISEEQFAAYHKLLLSAGMTTFEPEETLYSAYEVPYRSVESPLYIELHKHLFPPESSAYGDLNRFFIGAEERAVTEIIQGVPVSTLSCTDHLLYLICHAFKHFLHSGFGIRQVCDIILYANAYGSRIDWLHILACCIEIRAERFVASLFLIGEQYLVFDREKACFPPEWSSIQVDPQPMLDDLLSGGLYGDASMSRKHSSNMTLEAVSAQKQGRKTGNTLLASLFPSAKKLEGRYPYLKKQPYLLPVAWCTRILKYQKETASTQDSSSSDALRIGKRRVELLKTYGIIE